MEVIIVAKRSNGEGTIKKRSDGRWEGQYVVDYKRKSVYGKTQEEARRKLNQILNDIENSVYTDNTVTVGAFLDSWLNDYKKPSVKQKTYQGYEIMIRCHLRPAFQKIKLKDLSVDHVQRFINAKVKEGLSANSVRHIRTTLHSAVEQAIRNGLIVRNVVKAVKVSGTGQKERRILSPLEQQAIIQAVDGERKGIMILFDLFTGLRCGELSGVRWSDLDMSKNTLTVRQNVQRVYGEDGKTHLVINTPKTKSSNRTIPLLPEIAAKIKIHRIAQAQERIRAGQLWEDNDLVFCTEFGKPYDPRNIQTFLDRITNKIGIPHVNTHALRHAFATRALESGISLKVVSEMLGHSSIQITADTYCHVSLAHMETEILKLRAVM
jgi:integrase